MSRTNKIIIVICSGAVLICFMLLALARGVEPSTQPPVNESYAVRSRLGNQELYSTSALEIVCWGDSMTEGIGASPAIIVTDDVSFDASYMSYPEILEKLTGITTCNFGVSGATSEELAYMQGAINYSELMNPPDIYDSELVELGQQHKGDILVLEMGSNGGWDEDYNVLIRQYHLMLESSGCDKYIIIGDTDDPGTSIADTTQKAFNEGTTTRETAWEAALRKEFGIHFINMRLFLVEKGLEVTGLERTEEDDAAAKYGCVSGQLRSDWTHLNSFGYYAQAVAVYERGQLLEYW